MRTPGLERGRSALGYQVSLIWATYGVEVGGVAVAGDIDVVATDLVRLAVEGLSDVTKELKGEALSGLRIATAVMIHTWSTAWSAEV